MSKDEHVEKFSVPIPAECLEVNSVYYKVSYFDTELKIPEIKTLVYIGKDIDSHDDGLFYFQDFESFSTLGAYPGHNYGNGEVFTFPKEGLNTIFDISEVIKSLMSCAKRQETQ